MRQMCLSEELKERERERERDVEKPKMLDALIDIQKVFFYAQDIVCYDVKRVLELWRKMREFRERERGES